MEELKKQVSLIDFNKPYDAQAHYDIYDLVNALPSEDASSESTNLPPALVFYGIRNILRPTFILEQIPDLLNLLALVETFRRFAIFKSDEALELNTYYEREQSNGREQDVRLLAANELCTLQGFLNERDAQRREYIVLVQSLILLHIHYSVLTTPELSLMWEQFNDFFPRSTEGFDEPSKLLFHIDLTEDEKVYLKQLKLECQEWLKLVADWGCKQEEMFQEGVSRENTGMVVSFMDKFRDAFPLPYEPKSMAWNIEIYMGKVENMVCTLEGWFPPSPGA